MTMTQGRLRTLLLATTAGAALLASAAPGLAGAFGIREQSVVGSGEAFAGAASGSAGLSSMYYNPATITMNPGWQSEANATYIDPSARIRTTAPTPTLGLGQSGDIAISGTIPASFTSYQLTESLWLGLATTAPFGFITKPNPIWAGETYSRSSRVFSINVAPTLGWKVNEVLSVAAGPVIQYFKTRLTSAAAPTPFARSVILEGDDYGIGATVGATLKLTPGTTLGIGYRTSIRQELEGTLRIPVGAAAGVVTPARVNLNLPDQVNVGLSQVVTDRFRVDFGFEFTNWSRLKVPAVTAEATGATLASVPLGYKDGFYYSIGGEYQIDPRWAIRAGLAYETSPIDVTNRGTRVPDSDRIHATIGAGYRWSDKLEFNASYAHIFPAGSRAIRIVPGNVVYNGLPFFGDVKSDANIFGLSAKYRWDDTRIAEAAPIVRKY